MADVKVADVTSEGARLIQMWLRAKEGVEHAKSAFSRAECDEINAQAALAKWLMPGDMQPGEKVAVWFGDSLIQVHYAPRESFDAENGSKHIDYAPQVTVRSRGKHFSDLRYA